MIRFNELRITKDSKYLIVDVSVRSQSYYDNVYIDSIHIDTQDTYRDGGPSSSKIYSDSIEGNVKNYRWELSIADILPPMSNNLFFIYIKTKGIPSLDTPCGMDNEFTLGVTFNPCLLYNAMMFYVKQINNTCDAPKDFINLFLQFKALEISINTDHYMQAIKYYNLFVKNIKALTTIKTCGCYG